MDIKEIAQKLAPGYWKRDQWNIEYFDSVEFSEALISAYKDELLKEVQGVQPELGEPAYWRGHVSGKTYKSLAISEDTDCRDIGFRCERLYTYDQVAAAISKATKPLVEEVERLKGMVSEIQAARHVHQEHNRLLTQLAKAEQQAKELSDSVAQKVAEACALQVATETRFHWLDAARVAKEIRSGEWHKFVEEV